MTDRHWIERRACSPEQMDLFFPSGSGYAPGRAGAVGADYGPALAICRRCPVVAECRAEAERAGDIAGGFTTHGQVVGGCRPKARAAGAVPAREPVMLPCLREECRVVFAKRYGPGANLYCSPACAAAARKAYRTRTRMGAA